MKLISSPIEWISVLIIIIFVAVSACFPYFEAKSFNKCTGGNATYSTAVFTELRIENCKK